MDQRCGFEVKKISDEGLEAKYLENYLKYIFRDVTGVNKPTQKMTKLNFIEYFNYPVLLGDCLFNAFDSNRDGKLTSEEFINNVTILFTGEFSEIINLYFNIFDFDADGVVYYADIELIFNFIFSENSPEIQCLRSIVESSKKYKICESTSYDLYTFSKFFGESQLFKYFSKYLNENKPFTEDSIKICSMKKVSSSNSVSYKNSPINVNNYDLSKISISSYDDEKFIQLLNLEKLTNYENTHEFHNQYYSEDENLSIADEVLDKEIIVPYLEKVNKLKKLRGENITPKIKEEDTVLPEKKSKLEIKISKAPTLKSYQSVKVMPKDSMKTDLEFDLLKLEKENNSNPKFKVVSNSDLYSDLSKKMEKMEDINENQFKSLEILFDGYLFKQTSSGKMRKYWISFIKKDMFYFNSTKTKFKGLHNLVNSYAEYGVKKEIECKEFYSFYFIINNKKKVFFCENPEEASRWISLFRKVTNFRNVMDSYEILEIVGRGHFGVVRAGFNKKKGEKVAIKIVDKMNLTYHEILLIKNEIQILQKCKSHSNIVKLIDFYENFDHIYLVFEYLSKGNLGDLLRSQSKVLNEIEVKRIVKQVAETVMHLHTFSIIHRDLKPENIMFDENSNVKLIDFGLSKVSGFRQKIFDEFGTLTYVAPEIIENRGYNSEVDIWSLGVILFYLLTGKLPFDDPLKNRINIARKIVKIQVEYPSYIWNNISKEALDLVKGCLTVPERRINIKQFLSHPWFNNLEKSFIKLGI